MIIIAEAGVNHNGDIKIAKRLIDAAAAAEADYVKFQTFNADSLVRRDAKLAAYQRENLGKDSSQYAMLKALELSEEGHRTLMRHCNEKGIKFLSTAFDIESANLLHRLGIDVWKVPSGEITNYPLLVKIASYGQPVIMSTGMCTMKEVAAALKVLTDNGLKKEDITLLHCNTQYPTPLRDVNLRAMLTLGKQFGVAYGYSDHTVGIEVPLAATALGASVIEKHFTLDRSLPGPDQAASLEPQELAAMVSGIKNIVIALGSAEKCVTDSERENIAVARKSIVAAKPIRKGEMFTADNLTTKRPGTGLSPMLWNEIIGSFAERDYEIDEDI